MIRTLFDSRRTHSEEVVPSRDERTYDTGPLEPTSAGADGERIDDEGVAHEFGEPQTSSPKSRSRRRVSLSKVAVYGVIPAATLLLALAAGYMKWQVGSYNDSRAAAAQATSAATESAIAMLSYQPDSVAKDLNSASGRLTGSFRDEYTKLINDVVIPGAQQKRIAAVASVPVAAPVSADAKHVVVLAYVNQTTRIGDTPPTDTASSVRLTMERVGDRWLVANFEPV